MERLGASRVVLGLILWGIRVVLGACLGPIVYPINDGMFYVGNWVGHPFYLGNSLRVSWVGL